MYSKIETLGTCEQSSSSERFVANRMARYPDMRGILTVKDVYLGPKRNNFLAFYDLHVVETELSAFYPKSSLERF